MLWEYVYMGSDMFRSALVGLCLTWQTSTSPTTTPHQPTARWPKNRKRIRPTKKAGSTKNNPRGQSSKVQQPSDLGALLALEPRIMFDGAAFVTGAEIVQDQTSQDQVTQDQDLQGIEAEAEPFSDPLTDSIDLYSALSTVTAPTERREIVFIDTSVKDYQTLLLGIVPCAEAVLLDSTRDGMEQIAEILGERSDIDAIHLISHGNQGELYLGTGTLSISSMRGEYTDELAIINEALTKEADFLIYGCAFGQGAGGQDAASLLAELTGADIAASDDLTGSTDLGGDWDLEVHTGTIETSVAVSEQAQENWHGLLTNLTTTGEFQVNDPSGNNEETSGLLRGTERAVDIAQNGDYVVVWTDETDNDKIFAKVLDKDGNEKIAQFQVNVLGGVTTNAGVAVDDSGNFVVTWTKANDIHMRRFQANGTAVDLVDVTVNTIGANQQVNPSININGAGDFVIAWEGSGGANEGIFVRQGSFAGGLIGSDISVDTAALAQDPSVGIADSGDFVVVWDDGAGDVFFHLYNNAGTPQTSGQVDVPFQFNAGGAAVDMVGDGRFTVAYRTSVIGFAVYARQYDAAGNPAFAPVLVNTSIAGNQTNPSVSMDDSGDFLIVWEGNGDQPLQVDTDGVFGQRLDFNGNKVGSEFLINQTTGNVQDRASVAILDRNNFVVVWTGSDGAQTDVYARQYGISNTAPNVDLDTNNSSGATGNDYVVTFTEGGTPIAIADSDTDLTDADSIAFDHVTLSVSGLLDGNAETLLLDGDTFALATAVAGQDTGGGNYRVVITTGAGTATVTITKQGGGTFTEVETETLVEAIQYQHTDSSTPTDGDRLIDVTVNDGALDSPIARTTINVNPVNASPVAVADGFTINEGSTNNLNLAGNDTDSDDGLDLTSITIVSGPMNGSIDAINANGTVDYTHNGSETLSDSFTYTIKDLAGATSNTVTVSLTVTPLNDAPIITSNGGGATAAVTVIEGTTVATDVDAFDAEGATLTYSIIGGADAVLFTINPSSGVLTFLTAPTLGAPSDVGGDNVYDVIVQASDGTVVDSQAIAVTVTNAPVIVLPPPPSPSPEPSPPPDDGDPDEDQPPIGVNIISQSKGFSSVTNQDATSEKSSKDDSLKKNSGHELAMIQLEKSNKNLGSNISDLWGVLGSPLDLSKFKSEIQALLASSSGFLKDLNDARDGLNNAIATEKTYVASSIVVSSGLSIGYVIWLLRSGVLLTALLSSVPAWQFVNPLLVLGSPAKKSRKQGEEDLKDDSLESMFEQQPHTTDTSENPRRVTRMTRLYRWLRRSEP